MNREQVEDMCSSAAHCVALRDRESMTVRLKSKATRKRVKIEQSSTEKPSNRLKNPLTGQSRRLRDAMGATSSTMTREFLRLLSLRRVA